MKFNLKNEKTERWLLFNCLHILTDIGIFPLEIQSQRQVFDQSANNVMISQKQY